MIKNKTYLKSFPESSRWSDISGAKFSLHVIQKIEAIVYASSQSRNKWRFLNFCAKVKTCFESEDSELTKPNTNQTVSFIAIWTALKPVCLATAPVIPTSLLIIFGAWALIPWGRDSAYERGGDARRKFWIKPLKENHLGVAQDFFDPQKRPC